MDASVDRDEPSIGPVLDHAVAKALGYTDVEIADDVTFPTGPSERVAAGGVEVVHAQGLPAFSTDPCAQDEMLDWLALRLPPAARLQLSWFPTLARWAARIEPAEISGAANITASGASICEALARLVVAAVDRDSTG